MNITKTRQSKTKLRLKTREKILKNSAIKPLLTERSTAGGEVAEDDVLAKMSFMSSIKFKLRGVMFSSSSESLDPPELELVLFISVGKPGLVPPT